MSGLPLRMPLSLMLLLLVSYRSGFSSGSGIDVGGSQFKTLLPRKDSLTKNFNCTADGLYPKPGSCRDFYRCSSVSGQRFTAVLLTCPSGMIYDVKVSSCQAVSSSSIAAECMNEVDLETLIDLDIADYLSNTDTSPVVVRQKRFPFALLFGGLSALGSLTSAAAGIARTAIARKGAGGKSSIDLRSLENKLTGMNAKLQNIDETVLETRIENRFNAEILQNLVVKGIAESKLNFELIRNLQEQGILENRINAAVTQGLIRQGMQANELNFAKIHTNIGKLEHLVSQEINEAKADIRNGFASLTGEINRSRIEPLISSLLTVLKEFNDRLSHIQSLPEENKKDEIERRDGFIDYLEDRTLQHLLYDIINQNFAIPETSSDVTSVFILDMLIQGVQAHISMLSSLVSSNVFLAGKFLEERKLDDFNTYLLRVDAAARRMRSTLGTDTSQAIIKDVKSILQRVKQLHFIHQMHGLEELLLEKEADIAELEISVTEFIAINTPLEDPGIIVRKPEFPDVSADLPIGPWRSGKEVSYALQTVSSNSVSKIGAWSAPYEVSDKAHPSVQLPPCREGLKQFVYRKFNEEHPELVAIVTECSNSIIRDIGRDLINAAGNANEDIAFRDVQSLLLVEGVDVNVTLEDNMNPFHHAAKNGNVQVMKLLSNASVNIHAKTTDNEEALHFAALYGNEGSVLYLLSEGAYINAQTKLLGWSPLHIAVANNHVNAARTLIENNAFVNIKDKEGVTPLHLSVLGNGETLDVLLNVDTLNVNIKDNEDLTPLHYAARGSSIYIMKRLLQHGDTLVNAVTADGLSPLHYAAMRGSAEIVSNLINQGASVSAADNAGSTPLHYAAFYGNVDAAVLLNERDHALREVKNREGKTAFVLALENNRAEVVKLLRNETEYLINRIRDEIARAKANQTTDGTSSDAPASDEAGFARSNCTREHIEELMVLSEETCVNMGHITTYVNSVMSKVTMSAEYDTPRVQEHARVFDTYNGGLRAAQRNANTWRSGNSLLRSVQMSFSMADDFESTFNTKFSIFQNRLSHVVQTVDREVISTRIRQEISKLEADIQEVQRALEEVLPPNVVRFLENNMKTKQEQVDNKRYLLTLDPLVTKKLQEFIDFLRHVNNDVTRVKEKASETKQRLLTFKHQLETDKSHFETSLKEARAILRQSQLKTADHNTEVLQMQIKEEMLQEEIDNLKKSRSRVFDETMEIYKNIRVVRRQLLEKMGRTTALKYAGLLLTPFGIGIPLLAVATHREKQLISEWDATIIINKEATEQYERDIKIKEQLIAKCRESIANNTNVSEDIRKELNALSKLDFDLSIIMTEIPTLIPSSAAVLSGIRKIDEIFGKVTQTINELINLGASAATARQKNDALDALYRRLPQLQCYWKDLHLYMTDLKHCTDNFLFS